MRWHVLSSFGLSVTALGIILALATSAAAADAPDEVTRIGDLDVALWLPPDRTTPRPLVLFSHGLYGCKTQSSYLLRALAERGMVVAAPDHDDMYPGCPKTLPEPPLPPRGFLDVRNWGPTFYADRGQDLLNLRQALQADGTYSDLIDPNRLALVGHSLGGYTALSLAGAWPTWEMEEITAVVALASFVQPLLLNGRLGDISVPVMVQGGEQDMLAPAADQDALYATIKGRTCKIIYDDADHFAWTELDATGSHHDATAAAVAAFLRAVFDGQAPTAAALPSSATASTECK